MNALETNQLIEALNRRSLSFFVGADLPSSVTGLPSRADLARDLARSYGVDDSLSLAEVAQRVSQAGNRYAFTRFLRDQLQSKTPQTFHRRLAELVTAHQVETIITTAYDSILAFTFDNARADFNTVVRDSDLQFVNPGQPTVIWLYGKVEQPESLVVTDRDHNNLLRDRDREALLDEVRRVFRRNTLLFLGYDLSDPDFRFLFDQIAESRFARLAYAVCPGLPDADIRMWRDRGIVILETDPFGLLGETSAKPGQVKGEGEPTAEDSETLRGVGNRWAVLIGVNEYDDTANYGRLHVCGKDVHAMQDQLLAGGFDSARIRILTDDTAELPTRDNILVALKAVADATEPDDLLLFYYSGHGDEDGGESYLVARNGRRLVLSDTAVRVSRVKEIMEQAPARAKVIILDACHSGANIGGKGAKPMSAEFIRRVFEQAEGMAILASCMQGQLSYEWQAQKRSVFTHYLLEALQGNADRDDKGFVTVQDANRHVTNGVKLWASQRNVSQTPTLEYRVTGDIILARYPEKT